MDTISHIKKLADGRWTIQTNDDHCRGVAELCKTFASVFGMGEIGYAMGLLHDKGKERKTFQEHIRKDSGYDESVRVEGEYQHAFIGAQLAQQLYPSLYPLFCNAIAGHHRGMYDKGELSVVMNEKMPSEISTPKNFPKLEPPQDTLSKINPNETMDIQMIERMLFSCLVDADRLDTERFMIPEVFSLRGSQSTPKDLLPLLESYLADLKHKASNSIVNEIRNQVQSWCRGKSEIPTGFYSLTVPTGGGKTLSSVLWALKHAIHNGQQRIIIAIPYTSIVEQTAATLKGIFGPENVLEHHSQVELDDIDNNDDSLRVKLATENWDYPIIVTTNVQLFESLFSSHPTSARKIHNIVNSVIILDEAQTLPIDFLKPILDSLKSLNRIFNTSVLFTTASQPVLTGKIVGTNKILEGLPAVQEIIPSGANLHDKLRRVRIEIDNTPRTYDEIASRIANYNRVLCIVNTRHAAKELFERLPKEGLTLHLSRMMCPAHIKETISTIKMALSDPKQTIIRVVATQLIEAGVDIDFPAVFRQEAGLDSILQAAGRCNREGRQKISTTYVFSLGKEGALPPGYISKANSARLNLPENLDWFSQDAMSQYFRQFYSRTDSFDEKNICTDLEKPDELNFEKASNDFHLIDDDGVSVVVPWENSNELITTVKQHGLNYRLARELAQYTVSVRKGDFIKLEKSGNVGEITDDLYYLNDKSNYDGKVGLVFDNDWLNENLII